MNDVPLKHELPNRRDMLLSLEAHCFLSSWTITIRCPCGRDQRRLLPELVRVKLKDREKRTLGNLVRRLTCQDCGQKPTSVVVEHPPSNEREELVAVSQVVEPKPPERLAGTAVAMRVRSRSGTHFEQNLSI